MIGAMIYVVAVVFVLDAPATTLVSTLVVGGILAMMARQEERISALTARVAILEQRPVASSTIDAKVKS